MLAPAGDAAVDELRIARGHRIGAEAQAFHHAGPKAFDQHIGTFEQGPGRSAAGIALQIEREAALAAVLVGAFGRCVVSALDDDHVGAHVGQHHSGKRRRAEAGELDDTHALERGHASTSFRNARIAASVGRGFSSGTK